MNFEIETLVFSPLHELSASKPPTQAPAAEGWAVLGFDTPRSISEQAVFRFVFLTLQLSLTTKAVTPTFFWQLTAVHRFIGFFTKSVTNVTDHGTIRRIRFHSPQPDLSDMNSEPTRGFALQDIVRHFYVLCVKFEILMRAFLPYFVMEIRQPLFFILLFIFVSRFVFIRTFFSPFVRVFVPLIHFHFFCCLQKHAWPRSFV